jgi:hypothetical protein
MGCCVPLGFLFRDAFCGAAGAGAAGWGFASSGFGCCCSVVGGAGVVVVVAGADDADVVVLCALRSVDAGLGCGAIFLTGMPAGVW